MMMTKGKHEPAVLIVSACQFTRTALTLLLQASGVCRGAVLREVPLTTRAGEVYPLPGCPVRAVFFVLDASPGSDVWGSLLLLEQYLLFVPARRVVVFTPELNTPQARFLRAQRGVTVWPLTTPVATLRTGIRAWLPDMNPPVSGEHDGMVVPVRERMVLQASLVAGMDMRSVADLQCVSRKTAYTQRATFLKRLGVRNLQELLLPDRVFCRPPLLGNTLSVPAPGRRHDA